MASATPDLRLAFVVFEKFPKMCTKKKEIENKLVRATLIQYLVSTVHTNWHADSEIAMRSLMKYKLQQQNDRFAMFNLPERRRTTRHQRHTFFVVISCSDWTVTTSLIHFIYKQNVEHQAQQCTYDIFNRSDVHISSSPVHSLAAHTQLRPLDKTVLLTSNIFACISYYQL